MAETVTIQINLDQSQAERAIKALEKSTRDVGNGIESNLSKNFGAAFSTIAKRAIALGGVLAAALGARASIKAAIEQQDAINQLNASLRAAGIVSATASQEIQNFANRLQSVSTVADDVTVGLAAFASNFAKTTPEIIKLTEAGINFGKAFGVDARTAIQQLGQSLDGTAGRLKEQVPELAKLTAEQLKNGGAIDLISKKYAGFAEQELNTFGGRLKNVNLIIGDLAESLGDLIVQSPSLTAVFGVISKAILSFTKSVQDATGGQDLFKPIIQSAVALSNVVNTFLIKPFEFLFNLIRSGFDLAVASGNAAVLSIAKLGEAVGSLVQRFAPDSELAQGLITFGESAQLTFENSAAKLGEAFSADRLFNFDISNGVANFNSQIDSAISKVGALGVAVAQTNATIGESSSKSFISYSGSLDGLKNSAGTFGNAFASSFQTFGKALVKGQSGLGDFKTAIFGAFGDLLIQTGITLTGFGNAMTAFAAALTNPFTAGPAAIGIGLALIAVGGALKAIASEGASAGGGDFRASPVTESVSPTAAQDNASTQSRLTVNIQGDVLDSQQSALRIVELIKEATDNQGADLRFA